MKDVITLLRPRYLSFKNKKLFKNDAGRGYKFALFGTIGICFWGGIFIVSLRVIGYFKAIEGLGDVLAYKLLSMVLLTFFSLLVFSNILTSLSKLYLSRDLSLLNSVPVPSYKIFIARWMESTLDSSWMVIVYTFPVFISYGIVYGTGFFFYGTIILVILILSIIAAGISVILIMIVVNFVPANRIRNIFIFIGLCFFLILFFAFRFLRPERLVDPEAFVNVLFYLKALKAPAPPYLPSTWAFDSIKAALSGHIMQGLFHTLLSLSGAGIMVCSAIIISNAYYFKGLSKTQTAQTRLFKYKYSGRRFSGFLPRPCRAFMSKEIRTFFRDQTQWSQLFLIAALVVIYVYNFNVLPLEKAPIKTVYLQNLLSFLNIGLAGFVLISITARFAYPAVSSEGDAFWLVKSVPIDLRNYLWIKFFIYFLPLLVLTEILIIATNILLKVTPFMMVLSTVDIFLLVPGVVSMGIGFGAAYPDFKSENPAQTVTSFGGLLFMMICAGYVGAVIIIEAGPVYRFFMANIQGKGLTAFEWLWAGGSFILVFLLSIAAVMVPMKYGEKKLSKMLL
jgi:ABC-2 type transport system permease protein